MLHEISDERYCFIENTICDAFLLVLKEKEIKIPMINLIHRIVMKKCEAKKILTFLIEKD
mgnify:CR=1 FL=1